MTADLRMMLERQAMSVDFRPPDLAAIRRSADRRIRGRRGVLAVAGALAVLLLGGTVVARGGPADRSAVPSPAPDAVVTWAVGRTIHIGDETVDVGHTVAAYLPTSAGFATIDDADDVYSVTGGAVRRIGHVAAAPPSYLEAAEEPRIAADPRGTLVGWVSGNGPGSFALETFDQATGQSRTYPMPGAVSSTDVVFPAIDGRLGYWRESSIVSAIDLDTGEQRKLFGLGYDLRAVFSVENGVLAFSMVDATELDGIFAGRSVVHARAMVRQGDGQTSVMPPIRLSPSGTWLSLGLAHLTADPPGEVRITYQTGDVYNTADGKHVTLHVPGSPLSTHPVLWLDDRTVQVLATYPKVVEGPPVPMHRSLYTCTVPDGACRLATDLGTFPVVSPSGAEASDTPPVADITVMPDGLSFGW
jgi:hypothetical protein